METSFCKTILDNIINAVNRFPIHPAFCINEEHFTYSQFGQCISKIRAELKKTDYRNTKVGLVINDDLETYASIIALWLEGDCYVPLHPNWPLERCLDICEQVELDLVRVGLHPLHFRQHGQTERGSFNPSESGFFR